MCPLRFILIFLSATLAGFFVLRSLRSQPQIDDDDDAVPTNPRISDPSSNGTSKVRAALESGFWTFVDMASGRYLWRHLVSNSSKSS
ncbi:presequence protease 2, chloroplastic/mitochondrial [Spatholobus suberectus]|nr:presequence protease 2, chloroplastic/mitochondrial [Spatholobus suberectus]